MLARWWPVPDSPELARLLVHVLFLHCPSYHIPPGLDFKVRRALQLPAGQAALQVCLGDAERVAGTELNVQPALRRCRRPTLSALLEVGRLLLNEANLHLLT